MQKGKQSPVLRTDDGALVRQSPPSVIPTRSAQCLVMTIVVRCVSTECLRQLGLDVVEATWDIACIDTMPEVGKVVCLAHINGVGIVSAVVGMVTHGLHSNSTAGVDLSSRERSTRLGCGHNLECVIASRSAVLATQISRDCWWRRWGGTVTGTQQDEPTKW